MTRTGKQGAAVAPLLWALALAAMLLAVSLSAAGASGAQAQQGPQPVDDGGEIRFDECTVVTVKVLASDANFTNVFWRFGPDGSLGITSKQEGETALIGEVPAGEELILGIVVNDTGNTFKTGPGSRNPDGKVHAIVSGSTVGFEDKADGEPFYDFDYDDAVLELITEPCQFDLIVQVDPASTGTGSTEGTGTYPAGSNALAQAHPGPQSAFVAWSGDCSGGSPADNVLMDADKVCNALFESVTPPPTPTPVPPTPTPTPPTAGSVVDIDNTLTSANPARVGETVTFRVDVSLDVPAGNVADVEYTFDDSELAYQGASWNDISLDQCSLSGAGVIDCAFGTVSSDFAFNFHFEALKPADASTTNATLASDPDGAGPEAPIGAGPAAADVEIIAIGDDVVITDTGDGSVTEAGGTSFALFALLGVAVLATVAGAARIGTSMRS